MQVCRNGHVINASYIKSPEFNRDRCEKCGKETITECEKCNDSIPGYIHYPNTVTLPYEKTAPNYCSSCGESFPWNKGVRKSKRRIESIFKSGRKFADWIIESVSKLRKGGTS